MPTPSLQNAITLPDTHTVDIWQIPLDKLTTDKDSLIKLLDSDELKRYENFHPKLKTSYLISHSACREILSQYLNMSAKDIEYKKNQYGKPQLNHPTSVQFNMSHSKALAIIAISKNNCVGVDVEYNGKKTAWEKIAQRFFNPSEVEYLFNQKKEDQRNVFFQIWTRKEAYIKALGTGFATSFSSFNTLGEKIISDESPPTNKNTWFQQDISINPDYSVSITQNTSIEKIRYYSY